MLGELGYPQSHPKDVSERLAEVLNQSKMGVLVAVHQKEVVGLLSYSYKTQLRFKGYRLEIDELGVKSDYRGQGVGALLLSHLKDMALSLQVSHIILSTNRERESYKRRFYERNGFTEKNSAWFKFDLQSRGAQIGKNEI